MFFVIRAMLIISKDTIVMDLYKVLIFDDSSVESLFLKKMINDYCLNIDEVIIVNSIEEVVLIGRVFKPDIVFLDVMIHDRIVFDFIKDFCFENVSKIFMSSEKAYALRAFENNAIAFISKPFRLEHVVLAVNKAIKNLVVCKDQEEFVSKSDGLGFGLDYIAVASIDKVDIIKKSDIVYCSAEGRYTTFFLVDGRQIVSSKNLGEYEKILIDYCFYRVHNRYLLNVKYLVTIIKKDGVYCEMINSHRIPISKRKQESFNKFIRIKI